MQVTRRYTAEGQDPFAAFTFVPRTSRIANPDGSVVFEMKDLLAPEGFSQVAVDILAQKYFRKAGLPAQSERVAEEGVPEWLQRSCPADDDPRTGHETDARQVFRRLAGCWTYWGFKGGHFSSERDARAFHDEVCHMLAAQMAAPNSPQWFNTGLHWAYGIEGPPQGHYRVDPATEKVVRSTTAYEWPSPHACFIQSVKDDLVNDGGIMDLWVREARIFKYGSGTGSSFSSIRGEGEPLSGGGKSSGLMSFLKIGDRAAGAIKSGGTTRRAAKMVVLDLDHPDIEEFINWKVIEEQKVAALVTGSKLLNRHLNAVLKACHDGAKGDDRFDSSRNAELKKAIAEARKALVPLNYIERALQLAHQGFTSLHVEEYDTDWNSKAYFTVSGQNSNNSVRIDNTFMKAVLDDGPWNLYWRTEKEKARTENRAPKPRKTPRARDLWDQITYAAWACADPGVQFDTTVNEWHTCPNDDRINASNPCVTGDTLVATSEGQVRIDDLLDRFSRVVGADGQLHSIRPAFRTGVKQVFLLRTRSGYELKLTADHKVLTTNRGDVPAAELQPGVDHVRLATPAFGRNSLNDGFAVGLEIGRCVSQTAGLRAPGTRQGRGVLAAAVTGAGDAGSAACVAVVEVEPEEFALLAETGRRADDFRLRPFAFTVGRSSLTEVLRGLFTAAAEVVRPEGGAPSIVLTSSSPEFVQQVQLLLLPFAIR